MDILTITKPSLSLLNTAPLRQDVFFRMASCNGMPMPGDAVTFDVSLGWLG
jgi:hypothetical protein